MALPIPTRVHGGQMIFTLLSVTVTAQKDKSATCVYVAYLPLTRPLSDSLSLVILSLVDPATCRHGETELEDMNTIHPRHKIDFLRAFSGLHELGPYPFWQGLSRTLRLRLPVQDPMSEEVEDLLSVLPGLSWVSLTWTQVDKD